MISDMNSVVFTEAEKAQRKFRPVIQVLIFILLFAIFNAVISVVLGPVMMVGLYNSAEYQAFMEKMITGGVIDLKEIMNIVNFLPPSVMLTQLFCFAFSYIVFFFYLKKIEKRSLVSAGFVKKNAVPQYLLGYVIGAVIMVIAALFCVVTGNGTLTPSATVNIPLIILYFFGYMIQGAGEEIMCRGMLMVSMRNSLRNNKHKNIWAVAVSSVAFGLLHGVNPGMTILSLLNLILAGVFFAVLFIRFDNIWICCAAHSAWNFFQGHVLGAQVSGMNSAASIFTFEGAGSTIVNGGSFGFEGGLGVTLVEVAMILLLVFLPSKCKVEA